MDNKLFTLLQRYDIRFEDDLQTVTQCLNNPDKWQGFINEYISPDLHDYFKKDLQSLFFCDEKGQFDKMRFFQQFKNLKNEDVQLQKITTVNITDYKWSDSALEQISSKTKQMLQKSIDSSTNLQEFLNKQFERIFDLLSRKCDLMDYFNFIKYLIQKKKTSKFIQLFNSLSFADFVIVISQYIKQKQLLGELMGQLGIPIPIYYQIGTEKYFIPQITKNIFGVDKHSLILNIGSPQTSKCGKTSFLSKLMSIDEKTLSSSNYFSNIVNVFSKFSFSNSEKSLLIDFNGYLSKQTQISLQQILYSIAQCSTLLIIHLSQTEMQSNLLLSQQYQRICQHIPRILIYIRDHQKIALNKLKSYLPKQLKSKTTIRCLRNYKKKKMLNQHLREIQELVELKQNVLTQKQVDIFHIGSKYKYKENYYYQILDKILRLMNHLTHPNYQKRNILPNVCKNQALFDNYQLKRKQIYSCEKMVHYQDIETMIKKQLRNPQLSQFVTQAIQILQSQKHYQQIFSKNIYQWKKTNSEPLRRQFLSLTQQNHQSKQNLRKKQLREKIKENSIIRSNYQLSLDTIMNELVLYLSPNGQIRNHRARCILDKYYSDCVTNVCPINIIQGKTLTFGNLFIQEIISQLNELYLKKQKRVYVVSVIGAQSSAKSTLLNYLFRCKFQTSAGRCTKGIYMSFCQLDDLVIVVLDTEGLLSVIERDKVFDHQIATFVLKISNLIIINNKGQLTNTLKEMLQVCLYVLNCLHKDQSQSEVKQYSPQKILFTLRDQTKPRGKFQQEMAAQIKNSLEGMIEQSGIDYKNFLSIEVDDIFSLPNPFIQKKAATSKTPSLTLFEQNFGQCIIGLRKRISDYLKNTKPQESLTHFYDSARKTWQTIQTCGQDIMYYRNINEIIIKRDIQKIYLSKIDQYQSICIKSYEDINALIQNKQQNLQYEFNFFDNQLEDINQNNCKKLSSQFEKITICTNKQIMSQYLRKIKKICNDYLQIQKQKLLRAIQLIRRNQKQRQLNAKLSQFTSRSIIERRNKEQTIQNLNRLIKQEINRLKQSLSKLISRQGKMEKQMWINREFQKILEKQNRFQLKINTIVECEQFFDQVFNHKQYVQKIINTNFVKKAWNKKEYNSFIQDIILMIDEQTNNFLKSSSNKQQSNLFAKPEWFLAQIQQGLLQLQKKIRKTQIFLQATINQKNFYILIFGLIFKITKQYILKNFQDQLKLNHRKQIKKLQSSKKEMIKILQISGSAIEIIYNDINVYSKKLINDNIETFQNRIKQKIAELGYRLNPERIFLQAMKETLLNSEEVNEKSYYIKCYKLVSNINSYLFQLLCQNQLIITRDAMISRQLEKIYDLTNSEILKMIKQIKEHVKQKSKQKIKEFLIQNRMMGLAHLQIQQLSDQVMFSKILELLQKAHPKILQSLRNNLQNIKPEKIIISYIVNDLKSKVLGCQICCPICNMKCMLEANHEESHRISQKCHSLSAFAGCHYVSSKQPLLNLCQQKKNITCNWKYGETILKNLKIMMDTHYPRWTSQFPQIDQQHKFQDFSNVIKLKRIWANIQNALIISGKYSHYNRSSDPSLISLRDMNQLTSADLQTKYQMPLTKQKYQLIQYHTKKLCFSIEKSANFVKIEDIVCLSEEYN